jgi:hypothetical protein
MGDYDSILTAARHNGIHRVTDLHVLPVVSKFLSTVETNDVSPFVGIREPRAARWSDGKSRPPMGASKERVEK